MLAALANRLTFLAAAVLGLLTVLAQFDAPPPPLLIHRAVRIVTPTGYGTPNDDDWPPQRFTRNTTAFVHFTTQKRITSACDDLYPPPSDPKLTTEACSLGPPNELYMPNPCTFKASDNYARLLCHEIGHLNGWSDLHPR